MKVSLQKLRYILTKFTRYIINFSLCKSILYRLKPCAPKINVYSPSKYTKNLIKVPLNDFIGYELFFWGTFEDHLIKLIRSFSFEENPIFFDIGSNLGAFTFNLSDRFRKIYSFEASRVNCKFLNETQEKNHSKNIFIFNNAISNVHGETIELKISSNTGGNNSIFNHGEPFHDVELVESISIDNFVKENEIVPAFIKVDIEGAEKLFFDGASQVISKYLPIILVEWNGFICKNVGTKLHDYSVINNPNYLTFIVNSDSKLVRFVNSSFRNYYSEVVDFLFVPKEKLSIVENSIAD